MDPEVINYIYSNIDKNRLLIKSDIREISQDTYYDYINSIDDPIIREIINIILSNTHYIPFEVFRDALYEQIMSLTNTNDKFNIYFNLSDDNIAEYHWILFLFWDILKNNCVQLVKHYSELDNNYPVVFFYDCICSGETIKSYIDKFLYDKTRKIYLETNNYRTSTDIIVCCPYISNKGRENIDTLAEISHSNMEYISYAHIFNYIENIKIYESLYQIYKNLNSNSDESVLSLFIYKILKKENKDIYPLYLDHKISNNSFMNIYLDGFISAQPKKNFGFLLNENVDCSPIFYIRDIIKECYR